MVKLFGLVALLLAMSVAVPVIAQERATDSEEVEKAKFFSEGLAPVRKDKGYDVTIVYFMDYQCPACRRYTPDVAKVLGETKRLRVIYRDTPIFGPRSEAAARAAIASQFQGRHDAFHHALMMTKGPIDEAALQVAARKAGVDWQRLQADIERRSEDIDYQIAVNLDLSTAAGISGTPAFIIGDTLADGALDYAGLKAEIADARNAVQSTKDVALPPAPAKADDDSKAPTEAAKPTAEKKPGKFRQSLETAELDTPISEASGENERIHPAIWLIGLAAMLAGALAWAVRRRGSTVNASAGRWHP